jgi:TOBE domain
VRPSRLKLADEALDSRNRLKAQVHFVEFLGDVRRYHLKAGALELFSDRTAPVGPSVGDLTEVGWRNEDMQAFR